MISYSSYSLFFFFFNDTATTEIYTLSLHDALPIYGGDQRRAGSGVLDGDGLGGARGRHLHRVWAPPRHTPRAATTRAPHVGGGRRCGRRSQRARAGCRDPGFRHAGGALEPDDRPPARRPEPAGPLGETGERRAAR